MPEGRAVWPSIHSRIALASGTVRTRKTPGRSMPGKGGLIGVAPGDKTSLSYDSVVTLPVSTLRNCTVLFCGEMAMASQRVRTSMLKFVRNSAHPPR